MARARRADEYGVKPDVDREPGTMQVLAVFGVTIVTLVMGTALVGWRGALSDMSIQSRTREQALIDREFASIVAHWDA
jgi:hypothetical protein